MTHGGEPCEIVLPTSSGELMPLETDSDFGWNWRELCTFDSDGGVVNYFQTKYPAMVRQVAWALGIPLVDVLGLYHNEACIPWKGSRATIASSSSSHTPS